MAVNLKDPRNRTTENWDFLNMRPLEEKVTQPGTTNGTGIHAAPIEFSEAQITADPILHFFHYAHLPKQLQATSVKFFFLAGFIVANLPCNAERTVALRKLLEAKDAAVRANLPAPGFGEKARVASEMLQSRPIGEPVEIGGHDEDRDGPIPFGG